MYIPERDRFQNCLLLLLHLVVMFHFVGGQGEGWEPCPMKLPHCVPGKPAHPWDSMGGFTSHSHFCLASRCTVPSVCGIKIFSRFSYMLFCAGLRWLVPSRIHKYVLDSSKCVCQKVGPFLCVPKVWAVSLEGIFDPYKNTLLSQGPCATLCI